MIFPNPDAGVLIPSLAFNPISPPLMNRTMGCTGKSCVVIETTKLGRREQQSGTLSEQPHIST